MIERPFARQPPGPNLTFASAFLSPRDHPCSGQYQLKRLARAVLGSGHVKKFRGGAVGVHSGQLQREKRT
jgi:hypothetical protein